MSEPATPNTLEGWDAPLGSPDARSLAIECAFDYRGDVTILTQDGQAIVGYVFDRSRDGPQSRLRILTPSGERVTLRYDAVARLTFSGRDAAHGKSFETWVRNYARKLRDKPA